MSKKISIGMTVAIVAVVAVIAVICSAAITQSKMNAALTDLSEKKSMYNKLSELDTFVRSNITTDIDEQALVEGICRGYIEGLDDPNFIYMTDAEFAASNITEDDGVKILKLSDGSVLIIQQSAGQVAGN